MTSSGHCFEASSLHAEHQLLASHHASVCSLLQGYCVFLYAQFCRHDSLVLHRFCAGHSHRHKASAA